VPGAIRKSINGSLSGARTQLSALKTNTGDRPSASAQTPNAETMRKSCIANALRLTGYRMFIVSPIPLSEDNKLQILTVRPRFHSDSNARRYPELTNQRRSSRSLFGENHRQPPRACSEQLNEKLSSLRVPMHRMRQRRA
jgi:hypothetical protein